MKQQYLISSCIIFTRRHNSIVNFNKEAFWPSKQKMPSFVATIKKYMSSIALTIKFFCSLTTRRQKKLFWFLRAPSSGTLSVDIGFFGCYWKRSKDSVQDSSIVRIEVFQDINHVRRVHLHVGIAVQTDLLSLYGAVHAFYMNIFQHLMYF